MFLMLYFDETWLQMLDCLEMELWCNIMHETLVYVISIDFMLILYHKHEFKMLITCCTCSYHDVIKVVWCNLK